MLIVPVKEGESIERSLKKLKRKFDSTKTVRKYREKQFFIKPSVRKRVQLQKAIKTQRYILKSEDF